MAVRTRINRRELQREIEDGIRRDAEVRNEAKDFAEEVRDHWKFKESPVDTGEYAASVHVEKRPPRRGLPHWWVGTRLWYAHFIEYGTGPDAHGGFRYIPRIDAVVGENTPTPEFAPAAKTAFRYGGTAGGDDT